MSAPTSASVGQRMLGCRSVGQPSNISYLAHSFATYIAGKSTPAMSIHLERV